MATTNITTTNPKIINLKLKEIIPQISKIILQINNILKENKNIFYISINTSDEIIFLELVASAQTAAKILASFNNISAEIFERCIINENTRQATIKINNQVSYEKLIAPYQEITLFYIEKKHIFVRKFNSAKHLLDKILSDIKLT